MESRYPHNSHPSTRSRSRGPLKKFSALTFVFLIVAAGVCFFLFQVFSRKIVIVPGTITYDESLTAAEKEFLESTLADFRAPADVTISATSEDTLPGSASNSASGSDSASSSLLYDVLVPVADFYSSISDISSAELTDSQLISINSLTPAQKLLSLDGNYYLENFASGAKFRILHFKSSHTDEIISLIKSHLSALPTKDQVLSINQTGVTALTRAMLKTLNQVGDGAFFAEKVKDYLSSADLTHISNEVSFASDCNLSADMTLCSDPRMFSAITAIGTDIVELTGNHNNDWGQTANLNTIKLYHDNNMKTFGGGENETIAAEPLSLSEKGTNITWIGINYSTSSKENGQGATSSNPGANIYDAKTTTAQISAAKARGDFVLVDVQYSECYSYPDEGAEMPECDYPISGQQKFFRDLIDEGADMVVGTQAHQPQTYELYQGKPIYYGLGNLFFDQTYWPGTSRSLVLTHYFKDGKLLQTRILPTYYGSNYQTYFLDAPTANAFLARLVSASTY